MSDEEKKAIDYLKNDVVYWLDKGKDFVVIDIGENEKLHNILNLIDNQKKEIEELKNNELDYTTIYMNGIYDGEKKVKDKIREKIKELEEQKEKLKYDGNRCFADYEQFCKNLNFFKEQIDKILEEN